MFWRSYISKSVACSSQTLKRLLILLIMVGYGELLGKNFGVVLICKRRRRLVQRYSKSLTLATGSLLTTEKFKERIQTNPVSSGCSSKILLEGKILVESVPIWGRIEIYYFYNFADEYNGQSVVVAKCYRVRELMIPLDRIFRIP